LKTEQPIKHELTTALPQATNTSSFGDNSLKCSDGNNYDIQLKL